MTRILCLAVLVLASCGENTSPTREQNQGLNEADALLNEAPSGLEAIDDQGLGNIPDDNAS